MICENDTFGCNIVVFEHLYDNEKVQENWNVLCNGAG